MLVFGIVTYFSIGVLLAVAYFINESRYCKRDNLLNLLLVPGWIVFLVIASIVTIYDYIELKIYARKQDKREKALGFYLCLYRIGLISGITLETLKTTNLKTK